MKIPQWIIPVLLVSAIICGVYSSTLIRIPSAEIVVDSEKVGTNSEHAVFIVDGASCKDKAIAAMENVKSINGIIKMTAYASHNRIDVEFDPGLTNLDDIVEAIEGPVFSEDGTEILFNVYKVVKINGKPVEV